MSEENVEIAKALYPGVLDLTTILATPEALDAALSHYEPLVHPDFVTVHDPRAAGLGMSGPEGPGVSQGIEGFIGLWRDYLVAWDSWVVTPTGFVDVGDERVLVLQSFKGRSKTHGVELEQEGGNVVTIRDGKLGRLELFFHREDALEAAGLSE